MNQKDSAATRVTDPVLGIYIPHICMNNQRHSPGNAGRVQVSGERATLDDFSSEVSLVGAGEVHDGLNAHIECTKIGGESTSRWITRLDRGCDLV